MKYYIKYSPVFNKNFDDDVNVEIINEKLYIKKIRNEQVLEFFIIDENTIECENKIYTRNIENNLFEEPVFGEIPYIYKDENENIFVNVLRFYNTIEKPEWDTGEYFEVNE